MNKSYVYQRMKLHLFLRFVMFFIIIAYKKSLGIKEMMVDFAFMQMRTHLSIDIPYTVLHFIFKSVFKDTKHHQKIILDIQLSINIQVSKSIRS